MRYWTILLFLNFAKVLCVPQPIVGGRNAEPNKYDYQVSMRYPKDDPYKAPFHFCGGSIISNRYILTAAHCSGIGDRPGRDLLNVLIYCGTIYQKAPAGADDGDVYGTESFTVHEGFVPSILRNDIAVIRTNETITFYRNRVRPIPLSYVRPYDDEYVRVTGWGFIRIDPKQVPNKMQVIDTLRILNLEECMSLNSQRPNFKSKFVTVDNICLIGSKGQATCQGDSGGPVVYQEKQIGIVSFGSSDCVNAKRMAMAFVGAFREWICLHTGVC